MIKKGILFIAAFTLLKGTFSEYKSNSLELTLSEETDNILMRSTHYSLKIDSVGYDFEFLGNNKKFYLEINDGIKINVTLYQLHPEDKYDEDLIYYDLGCSSSFCSIVEKNISLGNNPFFYIDCLVLAENSCYLQSQIRHKVKDLIVILKYNSEAMNKLQIKDHLKHFVENLRLISFKSKNC